MKSIFLFLFLFCFSEDKIEGHQNHDEELELRWEHYKLENGLSVMLIPDSTKDEISVEFWIKSGSGSEEPGQYGLTHFAEHATPYGLQVNKQRKEELFNLTMDSNAQTRKDYTAYFLKIKPEALELALNYASDRLKADPMVITEELIERHRRNVMSEIARNSQNPMWSAKGSRARGTGTFGSNHPYAHGAYGNGDESDRFTVEEIRKWYQENVSAENTILFVTGNFNPLQAKEWINLFFKDIHNQSVGKSTNDYKPVGTESRSTILLPADNPWSIISWNTDAWGSTDDGALRLINIILRERLVANAPASIVNPGTGTYLNLFQQGGEMIAFASFSQLRKKDEVENFLIKTINSLGEDISKKELIHAKESEQSRISEMVNSLDFFDGRIQLLGEGLLFKGDPDFYLTILKNQNKITSGDLEALGKELAKQPKFYMQVIPDDN